MMDIPWPQIYGAVAGGAVGGFSGFIANHLHLRQELRRERRNIACALIGEIGAIAELVGEVYLERVQAAVGDLAEQGSYPYHHFRGERDYMPVFRGLGGSVGVLPSPLPRDLVGWYAKLAICLERARELHDLARLRDPDLVHHAAAIVGVQLTEFADLVARAEPLLERLSRV